jgi:hypothetical protein
MQRVRQRLTELLQPRFAYWWPSLLPTVQTIRNVAPKLRLMANSPDLSDLYDYLCEIRFALIFRSLGFDVEAEPLGRKGPDFRVVRDGHDALLECMRFRPVHPGPPVLDDTNPLPTLVEYGAFRRDTDKAFLKIIDKLFPQVVGSDSIIAIWNDDGDLEEIEVMAALENIVRDAAAGKCRLPAGLRAVLYGSGSTDVTTNKQIFCFELVPTGSPKSEWFHQLRTLVDVDEALASRHPTRPMISPALEPAKERPSRWPQASTTG